MKKISKAALKKFMKSYGASLICLLLAITIAIGGAASYSRYLTSGEFFDQPGVGTFAGSGMVNDVSALTFTNMAFWGGLENIGVSMNSLRTLSFSVNNHETAPNGTKKVSEVALEYALIFTAPENFASKLAIQLFDGNSKVLTPQILLSDIVNHANGTFDTSNPKYNGKDYIGPLGNSFMKFDVSYNATEGVYTATSLSGDGTVIKLEEIMMEDLEQTLLFRLWDVSKQNLSTVTDEKGDLLPPLKVTYNETVPGYKITISRPEFVFPAAKSTVHNYALTLAPTDALLDKQLGGFMTHKNSDNTFSNITQLQPNDKVYISTVSEIVNSSNQANTKVSLMGSIPAGYEVGKSVTTDLGTTYKEYFLDNPVITTVTTSEPKQSTRADAPAPTTALYRLRSSYWGSGSLQSANESNATHRITSLLMETTTTTTEYYIKVRKATNSSETMTTKKITTNGGVITEVLQDGELNESSTYEFLDAMKMVTTVVTETPKILYQKRDSASSNNWYDVAESEFSTAQNKPGLKTPNNPITEGPNATYLEPGDIEWIQGTDEVKTALQTTPNEPQNFTRTIQYTSDISEVTINSISTMGEGIPTAPFTTHPNNSTIQKYYVSPSYSKNYPVFVKIFLRQIQD